MIHFSPQFLTYGAPPNSGPHTALHVSTSSFFLTYCHPPHAGTALHTKWLSPHSFCLTVLLLIRNPHLLQVSMPRFWPMHSSSLRILHCPNWVCLHHFWHAALFCTTPNSSPNEYLCLHADLLHSSPLKTSTCLQVRISAQFWTNQLLITTTPELAIENLLLISDLLPIFSIRKPPSV